MNELWLPYGRLSLKQQEQAKNFDAYTRFNPAAYEYKIDRNGNVEDYRDLE